MRHSLLLLSLLMLLADLATHGQTPADSVRKPPALQARQPVEFDARRGQLDQRGMKVLGGWAVANLLASGISTTQTEGSARYFHQMNVGWGAVNLALAGASYFGARRTAQAPTTDRASSVRAQLRTENLYLFNAGLDVAYLATGVYLLEKSRNPTASGAPERWRGYGQSLLLQGGFLLLFDGVQYAAHHRHGSKALYPLLSRISVGYGAVAVVLPLGRHQPGAGRVWEGR